MTVVVIFHFMPTPTSWTGQAHLWGSSLELVDFSLLPSLHPTADITASCTDDTCKTEREIVFGYKRLWLELAWICELYKFRNSNDFARRCRTQQTSFQHKACEKRANNKYKQITVINIISLSLSLVWFNVPIRQMTGHFGDESSQAINYTGTDNEKVNN